MFGHEQSVDKPVDNFVIKLLLKLSCRVLLAAEISCTFGFTSQEVFRQEIEMKVSTKAQCIECDRVFDLLNDNDANEWSYGHDCEV